MPPTKKLTRAERKAVLLRHAEALIEEMLDWSEKTAKPNLTQIEEIALDLRQQFGEALSQDEIATQAQRTAVELPTCPQCGQAMRPKGPKQKTVVARVGELKIKRSYFYCSTCERGLFPPR